MQPVIIKSDQIGQTGKLVQLVLGFVLVLTLVMSALMNPFYLLLAPLVFLLMWRGGLFRLDKVGRVRVSKQYVQLGNSNQSNLNQSVVQFHVDAYWYLPWVMFVKLNSEHNQKSHYLYFLRSSLKNPRYSRLSSYILQSTQLQHRYG